ncbi:hypothetical protein M2137_001971 [Parabacteroides sp. PFB2-10]|nr:hypothetical protein [Parabacteroides sp. PFB2-10]
MPILLTIPYVKKCFSREFVSEVLLFCAQSPAEITNRKLGVLLEMGELTFVHIIEDGDLLHDGKNIRMSLLYKSD